MKPDIVTTGNVNTLADIHKMFPPKPDNGHYTCVGHIGEILQGVFFDRAGRLHRGLITLPCPTLSATCSFVSGWGDISVFPPDKMKAAAAARRALDYMGLHERGGSLTVSSNIPVGLGMGSSTSDIVATINAAAHAFGRRLGPEVVAKLAVASEVASDSTMFPEGVVLFAQREGVVLEHLGAQLPALTVVSVNMAPDHVVDTDAFPPARYCDWEKEAFRSLLAMARKGVVTGDAALIGRVATASARINQRFLPKPRFAEMERIAAMTGAVGIQVAHSGTVAGLLFDATGAGVGDRVRRASDALAEMEMPPFMEFHTKEVEYRYAS